MDAISLLSLDSAFAGCIFNLLGEFCELICLRTGELAEKRVAEQALRPSSMPEGLSEAQCELSVTGQCRQLPEREELTASEWAVGSSQEVTKCRRVTEKHGVKGNQSKVLVSPGSAR